MTTAVARKLPGERADLDGRFGQHLVPLLSQEKKKNQRKENRSCAGERVESPQASLWTLPTPAWRKEKTDKVHEVPGVEGQGAHERKKKKTYDVYAVRTSHPTEGEKF